jgi:hypothetical protein
LLGLVADPGMLPGFAGLPVETPQTLPVPLSAPSLESTSTIDAEKADNEFEMETQLVIHTAAPINHLDDGFFWRKYGQKIIKNCPYPRQYFKCRQKPCRVRKQVEDLGNGRFTTIYAGLHSHEPPIDIEDFSDPEPAPLNQ